MQNNTGLPGYNKGECLLNGAVIDCRFLQQFGTLSPNNEFDILKLAYSGSYQVMQPSFLIGDDNGQLVIGGCDSQQFGCINTETAQQLITVYPNIGLLSLLGTTSGNSGAANNGPQQPQEPPKNPQQPQPLWMTFKLAGHSEPPIQPTCKSAAILGLEIGLGAGPWVEGPLAWAAYFGGNALGIYGLVKC